MKDSNPNPANAELLEPSPAEAGAPRAPDGSAPAPATAAPLSTPPLVVQVEVAAAPPAPVPVEAGTVTAGLAREPRQVELTDGARAGAAPEAAPTGVRGATSAANPVSAPLPPLPPKGAADGPTPASGSKPSPTSNNAAPNRIAPAEQPGTKPSPGSTETPPAAKSPSAGEASANFGPGAVAQQTARDLCVRAAALWSAHTAQLMQTAETLAHTAQLQERMLALHQDHLRRLERLEAQLRNLSSANR